MIYRPVTGSMWDPSVFWHDGTFYAIMMYNPDGHEGNADFFPTWPDGLSATCGLLAVSEDGVHWQDGWMVTPEPGRAEGNRFFKAFIGRVRDRFVMNHGVMGNGRQDILRFYESVDLHAWTSLGHSHPDPRWYTPAGRWDHMYILPKEEGNPAAGFWGYPVATTLPELQRALGVMESPDGRAWTVLPPPDVEWGDVPTKDLEIGGCERIGDKYVIIGGQLHYVSDGYAMYTLLGDGPCGPFRPDTEAFRLCGTSSIAGGWGVSFLASWCRGRDGEKLISNYISVPSGTWMLPLRTAVFTDGHLRLGWWPDNDALKGETLERGLGDITVEGAGAHPHAVTWLPRAFDLRRGAIIEGTLSAHALGDCPAVGFAFAEGNGITMEIRLGIGAPDTRDTQVGRWNAVTGFSCEDVTGAGCATVRGIDNGTDHPFRLLVRHEVMELYLDDLLVQTYVYRPHDQRVGLITSGASATFRDIVAYAMTL